MDLSVSSVSVQDVLAVVALIGATILAFMQHMSVPVWAVFALLCVAVLVGGG